MTLITIPVLNRRYELDVVRLIASVKSALWNLKAAQVLALALVAVPLGIIGGSFGFSRSGLLTIGVMITLALLWVIREFLKAVWSWWIVWGAAALIWLFDILNYLIHARSILGHGFG